MIRKLTAAASIAGLLTFAHLAGAGATPGHDPVSSRAGTTAADRIECWIPQLPTWTPPVTTDAKYLAWLATDVRQRSWDGRWEVVTRTDRWSAPFCDEVLPGLWVAHEDTPAVQAYLERVARGGA